MPKVNYLCTASVTVEIEAGDWLDDNEIVRQVREAFFADIETYKLDDVYVEVLEEIPTDES